MDLRQLAALTAVADCGTFSAAAERLHTVQSNVSAHIARLERQLGVTLIDRTAGRLTEEGEVVVSRARRIHSELDALVADVNALRDEVIGEVRVGVIGTVARWLVPSLHQRMRIRHPGVHIVVVDASTTSLAPQLLAGSLSLAIVNLPLHDSDMAITPLFDEEILAVIPEGNVWWDRTELDAAGVECVGHLADVLERDASECGHHVRLRGPARQAEDGDQCHHADAENSDATGTTDPFEQLLNGGRHRDQFCMDITVR